MSSKNSFKLIRDEFGRASVLEIPIYNLGGDKLQLRDTVYILTPELYKALSSTPYPGKNMTKWNDFLMMNIIRNDLNYTGLGDKSSKPKTFFIQKLPK